MSLKTINTLKVAIVGCGRIAVRHSDLLGTNLINGLCLSSVCDLVEEKAQSIAQKYNVPHYTDMHEMLKKEDIDIISILTESGNHARNVIELAKYGKHIIVEKPMALRLNDADSMIRACDSVGIKLFVVKQNRFNVPVVKLKEALDEGRFGKLFLGTIRVRWCRTQQYYDQDAWRGTWAMDGGVLANQASHHIDLLEWMVGEIESVFAKSITAISNIEVEDTAVVMVKFRNGALGIIEATTAVRPKDLEGSISILGEKGTVEIGGFAVNEMKTWDFSNSFPEDNDILTEYSVNPPNVYGFGHQAYYEHVVDCIHNNKKQLVDGFEGRKSIELINAIYESIETGKEVSLRFNPVLCKLGSK